MKTETLVQFLQENQFELIFLKKILELEKDLQRKLILIDDIVDEFSLMSEIDIKNKTELKNKIFMLTNANIIIIIKNSLKVNLTDEQKILILAL